MINFNNSQSITQPMGFYPTWGQINVYFHADNQKDQSVSFGDIVDERISLVKRFNIGCSEVCILT